MKLELKLLRMRVELDHKTMSNKSIDFQIKPTKAIKRFQ